MSFQDWDSYHRRMYRPVMEMTVMEKAVVTFGVNYLHNLLLIITLLCCPLYYSDTKFITGCLFDRFSLAFGPDLGSAGILGDPSAYYFFNKYEAIQSGCFKKINPWCLHVISTKLLTLVPLNTHPFAGLQWISPCWLLCCTVWDLCQFPIHSMRPWTTHRPFHGLFTPCSNWWVSTYVSMYLFFPLFQKNGWLF